jgi:putative transposase
MTLFRTDADYAAFLGALIDTLAAFPTMRVLSFCVMPNHWHLVLWPRRDGDLARFMMRLTITHVRRWIEYRTARGGGHVYQGRYKSFACEGDGHLLTLIRYVERNARRAGLCRAAEQWQWSSLGQARLPAAQRVPLSDWPVERRGDWVEWVNAPQTAAEEDALHRCIREQRPFGSARWIERNGPKLGWREPRPRGRPPAAATTKKHGTSEPRPRK